MPSWNSRLRAEFTQIALGAAASVGVQRFVHLSTLYPYGRPQAQLVNEAHPRDPHTFKGRMRKEQGDLVLAADSRCGMRTTILRPPDFYGPNSELSYVRSIFDAAMNGGTAWAGEWHTILPCSIQFGYVQNPCRIRHVLGTNWSLRSA
jgi:nucleoside-diphosphate-sugar epimerase